MSFIESGDGSRLFYKDWGTGKPVVFLAGWSVGSDMWEYQLVPLAQQGLRCIAYDRRGHGRSDQPARGYDFDTLADDLSALLERLDLRDVTLVGHSMGCGEIVRYLSRHDRPARANPAMPAEDARQSGRHRRRHVRVGARGDAAGSAEVAVG